MNELPWIAEARSHIGTREIKGAQHEQKILDWWKTIRRSGIRDDETPWCAAFVGACLEAVGIASSRFESAGSYEKWGIRLGGPEYGCIVVFTRPGGGHVGFVVGRNARGDLLVLGGNQNDAVNIRTFDRVRVTAYRWPQSVALPKARPLPMLTDQVMSFGRTE